MQIISKCVLSIQTVKVQTLNYLQIQMKQKGLRLVILN